MDIFCPPGSRFAGLERLCDATIFTNDNQQFKIHRVLLASESEYFKVLFQGAFIDASQNTFRLHGINGKTFVDVLRYVYTGKTNLNSGNLANLLVACDQLSIRKLLKKCSDVLQKRICPANCFQLLTAASALKHLKLYNACFSYVQTRFGLSVSQHNDAAIQDLPLEVLVGLLSSHLNVDNEAVVWDAVVQWISKDPEERRQFVPELLSHIRELKVDDTLLESILAHPFVRESKHFRHLLSSKGSAGEGDSSQKEHLFRAMKYLQPDSGQVARRPSRRFIRGTVEYKSYMQLEITFDDRSVHADVPWFWIGNIGDKYFYSVTSATVIGHTVVVLAGSGSIRGFDLLQRREFELPLSYEMHSKVDCKLVSLGNFVYCIDVSEGHYSNNGIERHGLGTKSWESNVSPVPKEHFVQDAVAYEGRIYTFGRKSSYVIGGICSSREMQAYVYEPLKNSWSLLSRPHLERRNCESDKIRLVAFDGGIFAFGTQVQRYDIRFNVWVKFESLPGCFFHPRTVVLNGNLYFYESCCECMAFRWVEGEGFQACADSDQDLFGKADFIHEICDEETNIHLHEVIQSMI